MKIQQFTNTKLSLALSAALVGGLAMNNTAQAVDLDNHDRLGDAAVFSYYTAKTTWQTFIRLINTDDDAILLKVRFREAANSREVLDFEVALSPQDMWTAWTDANAGGAGVPGIKSRDRSCVFPVPGSSAPGEGWDKAVDYLITREISANFKDRAFTGDYDDGANVDFTPVQRMSEGHIEVIGVAKYDCEGSDREQKFCDYVTHDDLGNPGNCTAAQNSLFGFGGSNDTDNASGGDMPNVLAANAYLVNIGSGQGAGYNPDIFVDCADRPLEIEMIDTDTNPDLDSCDAGIYGDGPDEGGDGKGPKAVNQRLSDGSLPPLEMEYQADVIPTSPGNGEAQHGNGDWTNTFDFDINGDGDCNDTVDGVSEQGISESDVPESLYNAAIAGTLANAGGAGNCDIAIVDSGGVGGPARMNPDGPDFVAWRIKQKGRDGETPVTGGVDDLSRELMRDSVINEWAAAANGGLIKNYFTQWVLTFPTKHYYVDLQDDANTRGEEDISPTLLEVEGAGDLAFAPFTQRFQSGINGDGSSGIGKSCEPFEIYVYNREEAYLRSTSPGPNFEPSLCYETNVVTFDEANEPLGLGSSFSTVVPSGVLPREIDGTISTRGWAQLWFTGEGAWDWGLGHPWDTVYGLPVTGFLFSVYETNGGAVKNHTTINEHKYTRDDDNDCTLDDAADGGDAGTELCGDN